MGPDSPRPGPSAARCQVRKPRDLLLQPILVGALAGHDAGIEQASQHASAGLAAVLVITRIGAIGTRIVCVSF